MMDYVELVQPVEQDGSLFPGVHPLYNSVILTTLFRKLCPVEDLPKCRLVCKQWHGHSLDTWRQSRTLRLDYSKMVAAPASYSEVCIENPLKQLLNFLEDPDTECIKRPYRKLHLDSWEFQLGSNGMFKDTWIERLCWGPILGTHITTLTLSNCKFDGVKEFQLIIYRFCPALQNLILDGNSCGEQTSVDVPMTYREPEYGEQTNLKSINILNRSEEIPVSWIELFSHFPSLHSIGITVSCLVRPAKVMHILEALKVVKMQNGNKLPITDFDVKPYIPIFGDGSSLRICAILREYNIPVKRVSFRLTPDMTRELVKSFIHLHANSLITIETHRDWQVDWTFPLETSIKELETFNIRSHTDPFTDMEFLKYIPNLLNLSILTGYRRSTNPPRAPYPTTRMVSNTLDTEQMANLQLLKFKEFKLGFRVGVEDVKRLVKWLPNIQKLEMVLNDDQFPIVCENWTNLESLVVYGNRLTDTGVIGRLVDHPEGENEAEDEVRPNITFLDNLTSFYANDCSNITEASVIQGFLEMKKLSWLQLHTVNKRSGIALRRKGITLEPRDTWSRI